MASEPQTANASSAQPLLRMQGIVKRFGGTVALNGASLEVAPGEVHALMGENGSGKSTLMKVLAGIYRKDSGKITYKGLSTEFRSPSSAADAGIAIVHQELNLAPVLPAAENVFLGQELRTRLGTVDHRRMRQAAAKLFNDLEVDIDPLTPVERLPVALRQMTEIARALIRRARLLILDEPTSALSENEVQVLFRIVRRLRSEGTSIIYVSHKMNEIFSLADRFTVLRDGQTAGSGAIGGASEKEIVSMMVGRQLGDYYPLRGQALPQAPPILEVRNLTRPGTRRGQRNSVDGVSFRLRENEIVGIAGLVGAGRTELLETLFGAAGRRWSGEILLRGKPVRPASTREAIRHGIALVTEDRGARGLLRLQSVLTNATIAELPRLAWNGILLIGRERAALACQSDTMHIRRSSDAAPIESLSGGNQQKVILARWLMTNPKVLLLDEPTRGIDVGAKAEIYRVLRGLANRGIGILFVSSELPEVLGLADRILVMSAGRITSDVQAATATESDLLEAAMVRFA